MTALRGSVRARASIIVLLALVPACIAAMAGNAHAAVPAGFYGINGGRDLIDSPATRLAALQAMRLGGLAYVRMDASWDVVEPLAPGAGGHAYDWSRLDALVADLAVSGLRWYPMVGYSTPWAAAHGGDPFSPPANDADFAAFAAAVARRYGRGGTFWAERPWLPAMPTDVYGVWNEPNNPDFWRGPTATPARYAQLYVQARAAIRGVDPAARVTTAGLLDSGGLDATVFLRAMFRAVPQLRGQVDALDWHPYVGDADAVLASVTRARDTLKKLGVGGVPIEISEVGWHASLFSAGSRDQQLATIATQLPSAGLGVERLLPYVWSGSPEWQIAEPGGLPGAGTRSYFGAILAAATTVAPAAKTAPAAKAARKKSARKKARSTCKRRRTAKRTKAKAKAACVKPKRRVKAKGTVKPKGSVKAKGRATASAAAKGAGKPRTG